VQVLRLKFSQQATMREMMEICKRPIRQINLLIIGISLTIQSIPMRMKRRKRAKRRPEGKGREIVTKSRHLATNHQHPRSPLINISVRASIADAILS